LAYHFLPPGIDTRCPISPIFCGDGKITVAAVLPIDIIPLIRHRKKVLWLNAELSILRGLLHVFTTVALESLIGGGNWSTQAVRLDPWHFAALGQIGFSGKAAKLNWMLANGDENRTLQLIDHLVYEAGIHNAVHVLADINAGHPAFECLRQAGYCPYGWGQIWRIGLDKVPESTQTVPWAVPEATDGIELLVLQRQLLPPAVQAVSRLADERLPGFFLRHNETISAYADCMVFGQKMMVHLTHHTNHPDPALLLGALLQKYFPNFSDIYIFQRGDQIQLQEALVDCADLILPRFERMVKYLTQPLKVQVGATTTVNNRHHADPVTPILKSSGRKDTL
jgi:hypothetical protein